MFEGIGYGPDGQAFRRARGVCKFHLRKRNPRIAVAIADWDIDAYRELEAGQRVLEQLLETGKDSYEQQLEAMAGRYGVARR